MRYDANDVCEGCALSAEEKGWILWLGNERFRWRLINDIDILQNIMNINETFYHN